MPREHGAINLGQGFPDDPGPADVREVGARALIEGPNQYPPMMGLPALRGAIAAHYARHQGLALDPDTEEMVTSGATEAPAGALLALIEPATRSCSSRRCTTRTCPWSAGRAVWRGS